MTGFVTGSQAYGTPRPYSDIDVVILMSDDDLRRLREFYEKTGNKELDEYSHESGAAFVFGSLNLLCLTDKAEFNAWNQATKELVSKRPVTRDEAIACIHEKLEVIKNPPLDLLV